MQIISGKNIEILLYSILFVHLNDDRNASHVSKQILKADLPENIIIQLYSTQLT